MRRLAAATVASQAIASSGRALPLRRLSMSNLGEFSDTSTLAFRFSDGSTASYRHSTALFGPLPYGGGTNGPLYYPSQPGTNFSLGCTTLGGDANIRNSIVLLDRGGCHFTEKVLNAQAAGAAGVVLKDNLGICASKDYPTGSPLCTTTLCSQCPYFEKDEYCQCYLRYLADDGGGVNVLIPAFMVTQEDGQKLIDSGAKTKGSVFASMKWDIPMADGSIKYSVWTHSNDANAYDFRQAWEAYLPYLGTQARFTPKMFIWDGQQIGCGTTFDCATQCVNNGLYCSADPDGDLFSGISGADVVMENLRQLCVWDQAQQTFGSDFGMRWWKYADAFADNCNTASTWNLACSEQQMRAVGIDPAGVRACVADSNSTAVPSQGVWQNKLLQQQLDDRSEMMIVTLPTVVVQDVPLRGTTNARNVLQAMCASYPQAKTPDVCRCSDVPISALAQCVNPGSGGSGSSGMPGWAVALIFFVLFAVGGTIYTVYRFQKRTKHEVEVVLEDFQRSLLTSAGPDGEAGDLSSPESGTHHGGVTIANRDIPKVIEQRGLKARLGQLANSIMAPPPPTT